MLCRLICIETFLVRKREGWTTPLTTIGLAKPDLKAHRDENSHLRFASELAIMKIASGLYKVSNHSFDANYLADENIQARCNTKCTCNPKEMNIHSLV